MKIYQIPRINALGLKGPENAPEIILKDTPSEKISVDNNNIQESEQIIYSKTKEIFSQDEKALFVGGDHSITYPILKAFQEKNDNPFLIVFDAHIDCDFCAKEPTHEEWLRGIVESGFNPKNIVLIGIRKEWKVEKEFLKENRIKVFNKIEAETINYIKENSKDKKVYISIDTDALDPKFAPAVNYQEPNGLEENEFKNLLKEILKETDVRAIDIVEVVPKKDIENKTINLVREIISTIKNT
jgi:agmatinase